MKVIFYKNYSSDEEVQKTLTNPVEYECRLVIPNARDVVDNAVSLIRPVIRLDVDEPETLFKYNYAYIPDFHRYYYMISPFITIARQAVDKDGHKHTYINIYLRVDVLMSFYPEFAGNECIVLRNENRWNQYIKDTMIPVQQDTILYRDVVPVPWMGQAYTMILVGSTVGGTTGAIPVPEQKPEQKEGENDASNNTDTQNTD